MRTEVPRMTRHRLPGLVPLVILLFAFPLLAQVDRGTIELVATDETGATLPGATVSVRSVAPSSTPSATTRSPR